MGRSLPTLTHFKNGRSGDEMHTGHLFCAQGGGGSSRILRVLSVLAALLCPPAANATVLGDLAAGMQAGEWRVLSNHGDGTGYTQALLQSCRDGECGDNILNYADKALWDPNTRQAHFIGHGHLREQKFITYTEADHGWALEPKPYWDCTPGCLWNGVGHGYEHSALDPGSGSVYVRMYNSTTFYKYSKPSKTWGQLPNAAVNPAVATAIEYHPERGGLLFVGGGIVQFFNATSNTWGTLATGLAMGPYHNVASYNPVHKIVLFGGGNGSRDLYKIDQAGVITKVRDAPINVGILASILTVDPASGRYLLFGSNNSFYEYDVIANDWLQRDASGVPFLGGSNGILYTAAAPVRTHGVVMFLKYAGTQSKVWIYKHAAGGAAPPLLRPHPPVNLTVQ